MDLEKAAAEAELAKVEQERPESQWRKAVAENVGADACYFTEQPPGRPLPWQHIVFSDRKTLARRYDSLIAHVLRS